MRKSWFAILIIAILCVVVRTGDRIKLDDSAMLMVTGLDLSENGQLKVQSLVLSFNEEAKVNEIPLTVTAQSLRQARSKFNLQSNGAVVAGKLQIVLISKKLLQSKQLIPYIDAVYRDPKVSNNALLVVCDGSIEQVIHMKLENQPIITEYLRKLIHLGFKEDVTVETTLQNFHYLDSEKGITPYIPEIKPGSKSLTITGTALLNNNKKYEMHISPRQSALLLFLQNKLDLPVSYTAPLNLNGKKIILSMNIFKGKSKIRPSYKQGRFHFDIHLPMDVEITEMNSHIDIGKEMKVLEKAIELDLKKKVNSFIHKLQQHKVDPIGMGIVARAYQYNKWKTVEDHWDKAFADAVITVTPEVTIKRHGTF